MTGLGTAIREHRKALGWDQKALAQRVRLSPQYVCDIELGRRTPPPSVVVDLAVVMDIDSTPLMWLWLAEHVGDEMAEAMRTEARAATPSLSPSQEER